MSQSSLILTQKSGIELSKLQKQFNSNVKKIQKLKTELESTTTQLDEIHVRVAKDIAPLELKQIDILAEIVKLFDKHYDDSFFKKKEKEKIQDYILNKAQQLLSYGQEQLNDIFEKHRGQTFEEVDAEAEKQTAEQMKNLMGMMFGIEFDDDADVSTPEKMQEYMAKQMEEREAEEQARKAKRKKTEKQIAKEEKAKAEAQNLNKTARAIYTDLVKEFHPDREPNEEEKNRKTAIMHQITEAYEKNDLFELLRLKLALQETSPDASNLADEQLKYYNKILREQIQELEAEIWELQLGNGIGFGDSLYHKFGGDERTMKAKFTRKINQMKKHNKSLEQELEALKDRDIMKMFLKEYRIRPTPQFSIGNIFG